MLYLLHQALNLIDALGDFGTGVVLIAAGFRSIRAIAHHLQNQKRDPPDSF